MKSRIFFYLSCCFLVVLLLPTRAFANVVIHEVMYDLDGTDTDREWVEIRNTGAASVDVASFKLFEANVNHALTLVQGSTILAPGAVAIIASTPITFLADWPGFSGTLFDSSFSLSNTGETLGIKNGADGEEDTASYVSTMGAQGDGKSLGRSGTTFVPQTPSPGVHDTATQTTSQPQGVSSLNPTASGAAAPTRNISIHAGGHRTVTAGADTVFAATVYGIEGMAASDARVLWVFGNGATKEGRAVHYAYPYPGRYAVSVVGSLGEYSAEARFIVEAEHADVRLNVETDGAVSLLQLGEGDLDISLWQVERSGVVFRFPARTIVLEGEGIRLHPQTSGLPTAGPARLLYPNGEEIVRGEVALERFAAPTAVMKSSEVYAPLFVVPPDDVSVSEAVEEYSLEPAAAVYGAERASPDASRTWLWLAGALSLSALGASLAMLIRRWGMDSGSLLPNEVADKEAEEYQLL